MKRSGNFLFFLLAASLLIWQLSGPAGGDRDPARMLPEDTFFLLDLHRPLDTLHDAQTSRLGRQIRNLDWDIILRQFSLADGERQALAEGYQRLQVFLTNPILHELIDRRLLMAAFPSPHGSSEGAEYVFFAQPQHSAGLLSRLTSLAGTSGTGMDVWSSSYQGFSLRHVTFQNHVTVHLAVHDGFFLAAAQEKTLRRCLDLALHSLVEADSGLAGKARYRQARKRGGEANRFFCYAEIPPIGQLLTRHRLRLEKMVPTLDWPAPGEHLPGMHTFSAYLSQRGRQLDFSTALELNPASLDTLQRVVYAQHPRRNEKIASMPADLLVYYWTNWLDLASWWRISASALEPGQKEMAGRFASWLEQYGGIGLDELLSLFGTQFGLSMTEVVTSGFFPVPRLCACIEVKDAPRVKEVLERSLAGLPLVRHNQGGSEIVSLHAANGLMQPSYTINGPYLLIADNRSQIENILVPGEHTLVRDPGFAALGMEADAENNMLLFVRMARLIDPLKELVSWAGAIIAIRNPELGGRSRIVIDQMAIPLLDGWTMFRLIGAQSALQSGILLHRIAVALEDEDV